MMKILAFAALFAAFGFAQDAQDSPQEEGRAKNRRVELVKM